MMTIIFLVVLAFSYILVYMNVKDRVYRIFYYLMLTGFTVYSGVGIFTEYSAISENAFIYLLQFLFFIFAFFCGSYFVRKYRIHFYMEALDDISGYTLIYIFAIIYIGTYVFRCIFSGVSLEDILSIKNLFISYSATTFATRVERNSSLVYKIITNQVSSITAPFFYIMLYNIRKNHKKFIVLYCIPIILALLADGYLSRNKIAVYLVFIFIYLIVEEIIPRNIAKIIAIVAVPFLLFMFAVLANVRSGGGADIDFWNSIKDLVFSEVEYPKYYDYCVSKAKDVSVLNFIIYIFVVCIPSQFYSIFHFSTPNLAYSFTEAVTGLSYAQTNNYYILLPSVLGEALMLFGKYFAFIYGFIYGIVSSWFLKILKEHECLKYLLIYFLLDFFRQFRGGSQYVISVWETQLIPMIIIIAIVVSLRKRRNQDGTSINNYSNIQG